MGIVMTAQELFDEWLAGRLITISETSHDLGADYEALIPRMREVAAFLGIEWSPELVPEYVNVSIAVRREYDL